MDIENIESITNEMDEKFWRGIQRVRDENKSKKQKTVVGSAGIFETLVNVLTDTIAAALVTKSVNTAVVASFAQVTDLGDDAVQVFITRGDDRVCPICEPHHNEVMRRSDGSLLVPPLHERCRCRLELLSSLL